MRSSTIMDEYGINNPIQNASEPTFENPIQSLTRDQSQFLTILHSSIDPSAKFAKKFVQEDFMSHYNAHISEFMPNLVSIINKNKEVRAVAGYRGARDNNLFLEQYLDHPIETFISDYSGIDITRDQIVEVGNLACAANGYARLVIIRLTEMLYKSGYRWVAFTATQILYNSFLRLGLTPHAITSADPKRLLNSDNDWGSYYDNSPQVMFGSIEWGFNKLRNEKFL